nr:DUF4377 domain-containing protein [uncultured Carboxylicivirga sp.]
MKGIRVLLAFASICLLLTACDKDDDKDQTQEVTFTIYEDTGFGAALMSQYLTEPLLFSDDEGVHIHQLTDIIVEGLDFEYQRGYRYTFLATKVKMANPPADVSSIKYILNELVSKTKVITQNSEEEFNLGVAAQTIPFIPCFPTPVNEDGSPVVYDAMRAIQEGSDSWMAIVNIEGFEYEPGYQYLLKVKKIVTATPYSKRFVLVDVLSKEVE